MREDRSPEARSSAGPRWWSGIAGYFRALWSGDEPLHRVVISDLLIGGTLVNVVTFAISFVLFGIDAPRWLAVLVFLSPLPYSLFLVAATWRTAARSRAAWGWAAQLLALAWLGCMLLI